MREERWSPSQVTPERAVRAREVSRPTAEDLAEAEESVVLRFARPVDPVGEVPRPTKKKPRRR